MGEIIQIKLRSSGDLTGSPLRFLVFRVDSYYPSGGWNDLYAMTNDQDTALGLAAKLRRSRFTDAQVVDLEMGKIIDGYDASEEG
jgi:hypothetical protein